MPVVGDVWQVEFRKVAKHVAAGQQASCDKAELEKRIRVAHMISTAIGRGRGEAVPRGFVERVDITPVVASASLPFGYDSDSCLGTRHRAQEAAETCHAGVVVVEH